MGTLIRGLRFYQGVSRKILTRYLFILAGFLLSCAGPQQVSRNDVERATNLDLLVQAVRSVGADLANVVATDSHAVVQLFCRAEVPAVARFVEAVVVSELQGSAGATLLEGSAEDRRWGDGESVYRLDLTVLQLNVRYANRRGDGLFQQPTVERTASVRMAAKLSSEEGRILWADEKKATIQDRIAVSALGWAETGAPTFARDTIPAPRGFFGAVFEPVLFVAATGAVIYFFFTFRN